MGGNGGGDEINSRRDVRNKIVEWMQQSWRDDYTAKEERVRDTAVKFPGLLWILEDLVSSVSSPSRLDESQRKGRLKQIADTAKAIMQSIPPLKQQLQVEMLLEHEINQARESVAKLAKERDDLRSGLIKLLNRDCGKSDLLQGICVLLEETQQHTTVDLAVIPPAVAYDAELGVPLSKSMRDFLDASTVDPRSSYYLAPRPMISKANVSLDVAVVADAAAEAGLELQSVTTGRMIGTERPKVTSVPRVQRLLLISSGGSSSGGVARDFDTGERVELCYGCGYPRSVHPNNQCPETCDTVVFVDQNGNPTGWPNIILDDEENNQ